MRNLRWENREHEVHRSGFTIELHQRKKTLRKARRFSSEVSKDMSRVTSFLGLKMTVQVLLTLSLPNVAKGKFRPNFQISFSRILTNKLNHVTVQAESFHLNGHIIGSGLQTRKLESPYKTPSSPPAEKGLKNEVNTARAVPLSYQLPSTEYIGEL